MDLFSALTEDIEIETDLDSEVTALCEFVKNLTPRQVKIVAGVQAARDFEHWDKVIRSVQAFAYDQGLKERWWEIVDLVKSHQKGEFFHAGWNSAFDCSVALLIKPWVGKSFSAKDYDLILEPLKSVGFQG